MTTPDSYPLVDIALSRRLERAEGVSSARFVEAMARVAPNIKAEWLEVNSTYALFAGLDSPITQTFGFGMFATPTRADLDAIEAFFRERQAPSLHEVSPLADPAALTLLNAGGYEPFEFTSMLFRPIGRDLRLGRPLNPRVIARPIRDDERDLWVETSATGWSETPGIDAMFRTLGPIIATWEGARAFIAELDGQPIAAGTVILSEGVALLAGASTIPAARNQGAQLALLDARLRYAAEHGCDLASMGALPGSGSQRNAERHGFRIAYTRIKWQLR
ncbi:MAG TPA: GNAT family N-acetyltransferase [Gemmataceae bacterium]|jgi:GNAT superfamily N-acetyltransferase|nr:GNAT family N-acetyltransferase [Gemmataceae bacterium]